MDAAIDENDLPIRILAKIDQDDLDLNDIEMVFKILKENQTAELIWVDYGNDYGNDQAIVIYVGSGTEDEIRKAAKSF